MVKNPTPSAGDIRDTGSIPGSGRYPGGKKVKSENEVARSCPTLCNHMDCSLPGSSIHGILHAIKLEWVSISYSIVRLSEILYCFEKGKKKKLSLHWAWGREGFANYCSVWDTMMPVSFVPCWNGGLKSTQGLFW